MNESVIEIHPHLEAKMKERGVSLEEIERTLKSGWPADDTKPGAYGKVYVFSYNREWCGKVFGEKEVRVYYKPIGEKVIVLTVKARYGKFPQRRLKQ